MFFRVFFVVLMCASSGLRAQALRHYRGEEITVVDSNSPNTSAKATQTITRAEALSLASSSTLSSALEISYPSLDVRSYGSLGGVALATYRGLPAEYVSLSWNGFQLSNAQRSLVDVGLFDANLLSSITVSSSASSIGATSGAGNAMIDVHSMLASVDGSRLQVGTELTSYSDNIRAAEATGYFRLSQIITDKLGVSFATVFSGAGGDYPFYQSSTNSMVNRSNNDAHLTNGTLTLEYDPLTNLSLSLTSLYTRSERGSPGPTTVDYGGASLPNTRLFDEQALVGIVLQHSPTTHFSYSLRASAESQFESYVDTISTSRINDRYLNRAYNIRYDGQSHSTIWLDVLTAVSIERNTLTSNENLRADGDDIARNTFGASLGARVFVASAEATALLKVERYSDAQTPAYLPQLSIRYPFDDQKFVIGASYTRLYHAPTFNELYWKVGGNQNLQAEHGDAFELVFDVIPMNDWSLKVVGFYNGLRDQIIWQPSSQGVYSPINVQASRSFGLESIASGRIIISDDIDITLRSALTIQNDENRSVGSIDYGNELPYITPVRWNIAVVGSIHSIGSLSISNVYRAHRFVNVAEDNSSRLPAVSLLNIRFTTKPINLFAHIDAMVNVAIINVADVQYAEIQNYPLAGREYKLGFEFSN